MKCTLFISHATPSDNSFATVCSGRTFEVLKSVDMVGNTVSWDSAGLCGKGGQPMTTAAGSPALRCVLNIGGK